MQKVVDELKSMNLSGSDLMELMDGKVEIMRQKDLYDYKDIYDAMGENKAVIILYESSKDFGHWCLVFEDDFGRLEFFDPYGDPPDKQLTYIKPEYLKKSGQVPYLKLLLKNSGKEVIYNGEQLQKLRKNTNTCGRHCALRLNLRELPLENYVELITSDKNLEPDFWVSVLTGFL